MFLKTQLPRNTLHSGDTMCDLYPNQSIVILNRLICSMKVGYSRLAKKWKVRITRANGVLSLGRLLSRRLRYGPLPLKALPQNFKSKHSSYPYPIVSFVRTLPVRGPKEVQTYAYIGNGAYAAGAKLGTSSC